MPKQVCPLCAYVGPTAEGFITMERNAGKKRYVVKSCITCWLAFSHLIEDNSIGYMESFSLAKWRPVSNLIPPTERRSKHAHVEKVDGEVREDV